MFDNCKRLLVTSLVAVISVTILNNASAGQIISVPLSGTAIVIELTNMSVNPPLVDMGDIEIGQEKNETIKISNLGGGDENLIQINAITLSGANSDEFILQTPELTSLAPGESLEIEVTFFPITTGSKTATLDIDHDGAKAEHVIFLKGQGAPMAVSELKADPGELSLGTIEMGETKSKNITLSNIGKNTAPILNIESAEISGLNEADFSTNFGSGISLAPGEESVLKVTMTSDTFGEKSATLSLINDGTTPNIKVDLSGKVNQPNTGGEPEIDPVFSKSQLSNLSVLRPTTLQFGPDDKLYVGQMNGLIQVLEIIRNGKDNYAVTQSETISHIYNMTNHDDDGTVNNTIQGRLLSGLNVRGTANNPEIFLVSSDPRQGAGPSGADLDLDTNSGILSRLYKQGATWVKEDLLRGLPRSEENHQGNGLVFDQSGDKLLISMGGNTNRGAQAHNFAMLPEVALGAAIIEVDLNAIGTPPYDLPTLDDEDRPGVNDQNDPFGGNDGKNQAILEANGPVKIYSPGFRNAFDLVLTESNRLYTVDNGGNTGWGGSPPPDCSLDAVEGGAYDKDGLHYISHRGYYGGHPNPTRGKKSNTFNTTNPQSPIANGVSANPVECTFLEPGVTDGALGVFAKSTNGIDEYTASNFSGSMKGDLLTASFDKAIWRIVLNDDGDKILSMSQLFKNAGTVPLDVIAQGDGDVFPGTIWVADFNANTVQVFEPEDY